MLLVLSITAFSILKIGSLNPRYFYIQNTLLNRMPVNFVLSVLRNQIYDAVSNRTLFEKTKLVSSANILGLVMKIWSSGIEPSIQSFTCKSQIKVVLKLMSHGILHFLWSADLSNSFSHLIMRSFLNIFFKTLPDGKVWNYLTLLIS